MTNVKITDMQKFLKKVDACSGEVYIVYPSGGTENIRENPVRQAALVDEWREKGKCLFLSLEITKRMDAFKLAPFSVKK